MKLTETFYVVIRHNEDHDWLDYSSRANTGAVAMELAQREEKHGPLANTHYWRDNPIAGIAQIECKITSREYLREFRHLEWQTRL